MQSSQSRAILGRNRVLTHIFVAVAQLCIDTVLHNNFQLLMQYILETRLGGGRNTTCELRDIRNDA